VAAARGTPSREPGGGTMRLAIWSTTTPRENSTEMFRRQLKEVELAERIGIDQIWFFEHHLQLAAPISSPKTGTFRELAHLNPRWLSETQLCSCADYVV
jgi:hypothetical protein